MIFELFNSDQELAQTELSSNKETSLMTICYNLTLRKVQLSVFLFQKKKDTRQLKILNHGWKIKQNNLMECVGYILDQNLPGVNVVIHE